jgi:hypothetical protein
LQEAERKTQRDDGETRNSKRPRETDEENTSNPKARQQSEKGKNQDS